MRHFLLPLLLIPAVLGARPAMEKPNIVVILLDDAGYADFSHTGHPTIETPAITKLAEEGMNFTQFYSGSPACTASRYSLLTGRNPRRSGMRWVVGPTDARHIHPDEVTIAEGLKAAGYATGIFGKWHLGTPNSANGNTPNAFPLAHGFDVWLGTDVSHDYYDARLIRSNPAGSSPISGYETLETNLGRPASVAKLKTLTGRYKQASTEFIRTHKDGPFFAYIPLNFPHLGLAASGAFEGTSARGLLGDVMAEIDDLVAAVRATIQEEGIAENTLIIFTADNGQWIKYQNTASDTDYGEARIHIGSAKPFRDGKGSTWEGGVRVAGVWCWPGVIGPHAVCRLPTSSFDILPTVFGLAGAAVPDDRNLDGRDIRPYLNAASFPGSVPEFQYVFTGFEQNGVYGARKGPWKLHTHLYSQTGDNYGFAANSSGRTTLADPLLFNVELDPSERYNKAVGQAAVVAELQAVISAFQSSLDAEKTFWGNPP